MEYLTTSEMAKSRIFQGEECQLCSQNRIEGAVLKGNVWLIPDNAKKPEDSRKVRKMGQEKEQN